MGVAVAEGGVRPGVWEGRRAREGGGVGWEGEACLAPESTPSLSLVSLGQKGDGEREGCRASARHRHSNGPRNLPAAVLVAGTFPEIVGWEKERNLACTYAPGA